MSETPSINLEPRRVICALHGEPFRERWPEGYTQFVLVAIDRVLNQDGFAAYADGKVEAINALLDARPLCCRMSPEHRLEAYARCGVGRDGFCRVCRKTARVVSMPLGAMPHAVCFLCLEKLEVRR